MRVRGECSYRQSADGNLDKAEICWQRVDKWFTAPVFSLKKTKEQCMNFKNHPELHPVNHGRCWNERWCSNILTDISRKKCENVASELKKAMLAS